MKDRIQPSLCRDCGTDCTPCTGARGCRHAGKWEHYMVTAEVWSAAGMPAPTVRGYNESDGDFLCVGCLEARLGRTLVSGDFSKVPLNEPSPWDTPRLASRKAGVYSTAIHEAGHAVVGRVLGMTCGGASIVADD